MYCYFYCYLYCYLIPAYVVMPLNSTSYDIIHMTHRYQILAAKGYFCILLYPLNLNLLPVISHSALESSSVVTHLIVHNHSCIASSQFRNRSSTTAIPSLLQSIITSQGTIHLDLITRLTPEKRQRTYSPSITPSTSTDFYITRYTHSTHLSNSKLCISCFISSLSSSVLGLVRTGSCTFAFYSIDIQNK
jgi:hypothetical protein